MEINKLNNHELGAALVTALGLPKRTISLELSMKAGDPLRVRCEYLPDNITRSNAERLIAEFEQIEMSTTRTVRTTRSIDEQFEMTNEELAKAIDRAHQLTRGTASSEPTFAGLVAHLNELLAIQRARAGMVSLTKAEGSQ